MAKKPELVSSPRRISFHGIEEAAQSFEYKDLLKVVPASGDIAIAVTASGRKILGQAQADASGVTGTAVSVDEWFSGDEIVIDCWDSSDGAAEAASSFIPGVLYGLLLVGTNDWYADLSNTGIASMLEFIEAAGDLRDTLTDQTITRGRFRIAEGFCVSAAGAGS